MTENLITKFAPYPKTEAEATAQNVYRHLLISAQVAHLRWMADGDRRRKTPSDDPAYRDVITTYLAGAELFVSHWSTLHLMRHAMGFSTAWVRIGSNWGDPSQPATPTADDIARDMWIGWEDGGGPAEVLWDWLVEAGIDPEEIGREFEKVANTP